jgi:hypothetical protein
MRAFVVTAVLMSLPLLCLAKEQGQQCSATGKEIASLMETTKVNAVVDFAGPESAYKSDGDPETLEIVFLAARKGAAGHVTDDGEVIFQYENASDEEAQQLITFAFCLRVVARKSN